MEIKGTYNQTMIFTDCERKGPCIFLSMIFKGRDGKERSRSQSNGLLLL